jgi:ankyrin repeat protein
MSCHFCKLSSISDFIISEINSCDDLSDHFTILSIFLGSNVHFTSWFLKSDKLRWILFRAISLGNFKLVNLMIRVGVSLEFRINRFTTPLMLAVRENQFPIVRFLLRSKCNIEFKSKERTVLTICMQYKECLKVAGLLVMAKANIHKLTYRKLTYLQHAARFNNLKCIELLILAGADVNQKIVNYRHPLSCPLSGYRSHEVREIVEYLLSVGSKVDVPDENGETALMHACKANDVECVELLINARADVNHRNNQLVTPLLYACEESSKVSVKLLLEARANPNYIDEYGVSPLMKVPLYKDCSEVFRYLLQAGAHQRELKHKVKMDGRGNLRRLLTSLDIHPK